MTVRKGKKLTISIQEHMAIDVCPGPIRPIRQISAYFPRLSPTAEPVSSNPSALALSPGGGAPGGTSGGLLSPLSAGARGGGGTLSAASSIETSVDICSSDSDDCTALGTLEFELRYERATCSLHCNIIRAKANKLKTKTVRNSLNPVWNEILTYIGITEEDMHRKTLRLSVCDEDKLTHNEFIGESRVALRRVKPDQTKRFYTCLEHPPPWENEQLTSLEERGRMLLSLQFLTPPEEGDGDSRRGGLCVGVLRCAHLAAMDVNGFSDPYVKISLLTHSHDSNLTSLYLLKSSSALSSTGATLGKDDIATPPNSSRGKIPGRNSWQEQQHEFFYEIPLAELVHKTLEVTVWDYDLGRSNDFIGGVCLSCQVQGDALRHWMDSLRNKGQRVERWHILTNELPQTTCHD
ncbi:Double C2-like domain-containing protein beta [Triplophysa tibetana]|uniref:Double C2-like domain-containing protein beta n=1 Tax=Triplophysa tibetana TaxID=1572043 RepID=A0A5A9N9K9_9TELE|nr:Double C2-like domain-containing protein beta [Triplophysa tibetana]